VSQDLWPTSKGGPSYKEAQPCGGFPSASSHPENIRTGLVCENEGRNQYPWRRDTDGLAVDRPYREPYLAIEILQGVQKVTNGGTGAGAAFCLLFFLGCIGMAIIQSAFNKVAA